MAELGAMLALLTLLSMFAAVSGSSCSLVGVWTGTTYEDYPYDTMAEDITAHLSSDGTADVTVESSVECYGYDDALSCSQTYDGTWQATDRILALQLTCTDNAGGLCCSCETDPFVLSFIYGSWDADCDSFTGILGEEEVVFTRQVSSDWWLYILGLLLLGCMLGFIALACIVAVKVAKQEPNTAYENIEDEETSSP